MLAHQRGLAAFDVWPAGPHLTEMQYVSQTCEAFLWCSAWLQRSVVRHCLSCLSSLTSCAARLSCCMCLACSLVRLELLEGVQAYYARDYKASYNSLKVMGALHAGLLDRTPAAALVTDRQPCLPCRVPSRSGRACRSLTTAWLC